MLGFKHAASWVTLASFVFRYNTMPARRKKNVFKYLGCAFHLQNPLFTSRVEGEQIPWSLSKRRHLNLFFSDSAVCFRLDMMARTWGTAPSARGCSWFCGWKEWSLQWPPLTWGSKQTPPLLWHKKHFLSIWSWGLSHRTLIKKRHKRERERFPLSNPKPFLT